MKSIVRRAFSRSMSIKPHNNFAASHHGNPLLPSMIVFDLDDCLWTPEMHELSGMPSIPVKGTFSNKEVVVGVKVPRSHDEVRLYEGARQALHELATDPQYEGIVLATASSSLEPAYSHACLRMIEILPGLTLSDMFRHNAIGRTGRLTPNKKTHFQLLQEESGIDFEEMLFFDDCNWGDHCEVVSRAFGVVSQRTPNGLQYKEFLNGLKKFRKGAEDLLGSAKFN